MTISIITTLLISGFIVGFLNTLAAGASVVSMTLFLAMELPIVEAIATNRLAIFLQNLVSTIVFKKQKMFDFGKGVKYAIPVSLGSIIGAQASVLVAPTIIEWLYITALFVILSLVMTRQQVWLKGRIDGEQKMGVLQTLLLFSVGLYGGSVYIGQGYFMLSVLVIAMGLDLIKANATKGLLVLITTPFSLVIFMIHGEVNYEYGLIHAIGNIIGAYIAAHYAAKIGTKTIRYILIFLITVSILFALKVIDAKYIIPY